MVSRSQKAHQVMKAGIKRSRRPQNIADLALLLRAFGPTQRCLEAATRQYLKDVKARPRKGKSASAVGSI